jgi:hypothetical protein
LPGLPNKATPNVSRVHTGADMKSVRRSDFAPHENHQNIGRSRAEDASFNPTLESNLNWQLMEQR